MTPDLSLRVPVNAINQGEQESTQWGYSTDVGVTDAIMARARFASTHYPCKAVVKFFSGLAAVLLLTLALQVCALQAGSPMHPATVVLVLFLTTWIGVAGLASAVLVPIVLFVWAAVAERVPSLTYAGGPQRVLGPSILRSGHRC